MNGDFQNILNILNKPDNGFTGSNMTSGQVRLLAERREKATYKPESGGTAGVQVARDFADIRANMLKEQRIANVEAQGFTRAEAEAAYEKLREREAQTALFQQESVASRFANLIDSRLGGVEDGQFPSNNESAKYLAYAGGKQELRTVKELLFTAARSKAIREQQAAITIQGAVRTAFNKPPEQNLAAAIQQAVALKRGRGRPAGSKDKAPRERPSGLVYKKGGGGGGAGV
jgi:hypothetical protein